MTTLPGLDPFDNLVEPTASAIYYLTRIGADWRLEELTNPSTLAGVIDGLVPGRERDAAKSRQGRDGYAGVCHEQRPGLPLEAEPAAGD